MTDATIRVNTKVDNSDVKKFGEEFVASGKKWTSAIGNVGSALGKLTLKLGAVGLLIKGISALVSMTKEGFKNLAQTGGEYNRVMSDFKSQTEQLKNALATAFEPIAVMIIPLLTKLCEWLTTAADYVAQFFAVLSGKETYTKAKKQNVDYAKSLAKTTKEAKKALATFDELNVLTSGSAGGGGGVSNGGATTGADAFETVSIEGFERLKKAREVLKDFIDELKPKMKKFYDEVLVPMGKELADTLPEASGLFVDALEELGKAGLDYLDGDMVGAWEHLKNATEDYQKAWETLCDGVEKALEPLNNLIDDFIHTNLPPWAQKLLDGLNGNEQAKNNALNKIGLTGDKRFALGTASPITNNIVNSVGTMLSNPSPMSVANSTATSIGNVVAAKAGEIAANLYNKITGKDETINLNVNLDGDTVYNSVVLRNQMRNRSLGF